MASMARRRGSLGSFESLASSRAALPENSGCHGWWLGGSVRVWLPLSNVGDDACFSNEMQNLVSCISTFEASSAFANE